MGVLLYNCPPKSQEPAKVEPAKVKPFKVEPTKVKPVQVEPAKVEPAKVKPAKVEPAKLERNLQDWNLPYLLAYLASSLDRYLFPAIFTAFKTSVRVVAKEMAQGQDLMVQLRV